MQTKQIKTHTISIRMNEDRYNKLLEFCEKSGQSKTVAFERALDAYLAAYTRDEELLLKIKNET